MKNLTWKLFLTAGVSCVLLLGKTSTARAGEDNPGGPDERMQRLEQRLNEMNQRQQQILNRMESLQGAMPGAGRGNMPPPGAPMGARGGGPGFRPMPAQGFEGVQPPPAQEWPNGALTVRINRLGDMVRLCFLGFVICNILSAIWIFSDIRKRGEGPGIFVALALLAGIPAAIIYSLVRLGDRITVAAK